jgi:alpha-tubulin suppressor-like RCC1 family protein
MALRKNGTLVEWGNIATRWIPAPALSNAVAIAAGDSHSLALRSDGTVVSWGSEGFYHDAPATLTNVLAVVASPSFAGRDLAITSDHTVAEWDVQGATLTGERVPYDENGVKGFAIMHVDYHVIGGLSNVVQITAGETADRRGPGLAFSLALRNDGTVFAWQPSSGATTSDTGLMGANVNFSAAGLVRIDGQVLSNVVAIAAGYCGLGLKSDGRMVVWEPAEPQPTIIPSGLANVLAIAARGNLYLAVVTNSTAVDFGR